MGDILGIPNVDDFIRRLDAEKETQHESSSAKFSKLIQEMFPDVDVSFLSQECRNLVTEEDFIRFINTVMLSGVYPKESPVWSRRRSAASFADCNGPEIVDYFYYKPVVYSSDEEAFSLKTTGSGVCQGKTKERELSDSPVDAGPSTSATSADDFTLEAAENDTVELKDSGGGDEGHSGAAEEGPQTADAHFTSDSSPPKRNTNRDVNFHKATVDREMLPGTSNEAVGHGNLEDAGTSGNVEDFGGTPREENSVTSEEWLQEQTAELIRLFPNTDPTFLRAECAKFEGSLEAMNEFVLSKLEKNDMPSRAEYEERQEMERLQNLYTKNFSVEDFLKFVPDPWTYFRNSNRNCARNKAHGFIFLEDMFGNIPTGDLINTMMKNNFNLYLSYKDLQQKASSDEVGGRPVYECYFQRPTRTNIQFLQEVAFIQNEEKIRDFVEAREAARQSRLEEAKRAGGTVLECNCCYDAEVVAEDVVYCPNGDSFCKTCIIKYVEMEMAEARFEFPCLAGCGEKYNLFTLQNVVKAEVMSKIFQAKQMEEIQAAGIEDLVQCPFCSYAAILPPEEKILSCLNPECQKKTCRLCKELSHIPLRCNEVEMSEEVKLRRYVENKMTQALIRTCYSCGKGFVKEDGCNKIVCKCGAKMCYVCRKPVTDYSHFNAIRAINSKKCPLYSTNEELHVQLVNKAAEEARAEILANPNKALKRDAAAVPPERCKKRSQPMRVRAGTIASAARARLPVSQKCKRLRATKK